MGPPMSACQSSKSCSSTLLHPHFPIDLEQSSGTAGCVKLLLGYETDGNGGRLIDDYVLSAASSRSREGDLTVEHTRCHRVSFHARMVRPNSMDLFHLV